MVLRSSQSLVIALMFAAAACLLCCTAGSATSTSVPGGGSGGGGGGTSGGRTSTTCSVERAAGTANIPSGQVCTTDTDCMKGKSGRCLYGGGNGKAQCTYDECTADADCGNNKICACRTEVGQEVNKCQPMGNCATDSDCGGKACTVTLSAAKECGQVSYGTYCRTGSDQCTSNTDCSTSGTSACVYNTTSTRFECLNACSAQASGG